jgi:hypothetical protein
MIEAYFLQLEQVIQEFPNCRLVTTPLGNTYLQALLDVAKKLSIFCSCYTKQSLVIVTPKPEFGSEMFN